MPLKATDMYLTEESGNGRDENGRLVIVRAPAEVRDRFGWDAIWEKASEKYDNEDVDTSGRYPLVEVTVKDF